MDELSRAKGVMKNIYLVEVPLPGSPLKILNSYIIKGADRHLLIDVGYNTNEGEAAIIQAFSELGLKINDADIFLTHLHGDHTGCIERFKKVCGDIFISEIDGKLLDQALDERCWIEEMALQKSMGYPEKDILSYLNHPAYEAGMVTYTHMRYIKEGDTFEIGGYTFEAIDLKGHTPGLMGLYEKKYKILICGDHILNKITPHISAWDTENDYLGLFFQSLRRTKEMDINLVLPGHRSLVTDHVKRINQLYYHHDKRLNHILRLLRDGKKTIYEVALDVPWDYGGGVFEKFPKEQKWFAGNEVFAHLEHLRTMGKIKREIFNIYYYFLIS